MKSIIKMIPFDLATYNAAANWGGSVSERIRGAQVSLSVEDSFGIVLGWGVFLSPVILLFIH